MGHATGWSSAHFHASDRDQDALCDGARFQGILLGLAFASPLIVQHASIFVGLMSRTSTIIRETSQADLRVTDPGLLSVDDAKALRETDLQRVRGIPGVAWAVPLFKGLLGVRLGDGRRTDERGHQAGRTMSLGCTTRS